jgi:hypothetical protein
MNTVQTLKTKIQKINRMISKLANKDLEIGTKKNYILYFKLKDKKEELEDELMLEELFFRKGTTNE